MGLLLRSVGVQFRIPPLEKELKMSRGRRAQCAKYTWNPDACSAKTSILRKRPIQVSRVCFPIDYTCSFVVYLPRTCIEPPITENPLNSIIGSWTALPGSESKKACATTVPEPFHSGSRACGTIW